MPTKIAWASESWNPITGCTPISPGCANCYAKRMANRLKGRYGYPADDPFKVTLHDDKTEDPMYWRKPRKIFVCSMGDLFHVDVPRSWLSEIFSTMASCEYHTFLVLTKRPENYTSKVSPLYVNLPNLWLGVSVENYACQWRIDELAKIPAAVRFVSFEPVLEEMVVRTRDIHWAIIGCESGPKRRPCKLEWIRSLVYQFKSEGKPVFVKQIEINGKVSHDMSEWPEDLRVQEYPRKDGE